VPRPRQSQTKKGDGRPGRLFVLYENENLKDPANFTENDYILRVRYETNPIKSLGNPRAVTCDDSTFESFLEAAREEDLERLERAKAENLPPA